MSSNPSTNNDPIDVITNAIKELQRQFRELRSSPLPNWTVPTMSNNWVRYDETYSDVGYVKDSNGFVHLRGMIKSGTSGAIFQLPTGYRPIERVLHVSISNGALARVDVRTDGIVEAVQYNNTWLSLEGITFRAEQ